MTSATYAYVPHHRQKEFEALGWEYEADLGLPHCVYSSLYKWVGEGEPNYPKIEIEIRKREDGTGSFQAED